MVVGQIIDPDPMVALFGVCDDLLPSLRSEQRRVVVFSTLLARRTLLLKWKGDTPPSPEHWLRDLASCLKLEKIRASLRGSEEKFNTTWKNFLAYINDDRLARTAHRQPTVGQS